MLVQMGTLERANAQPWVLLLVHRVQRLRNTLLEIQSPKGELPMMTESTTSEKTGVQKRDTSIVVSVSVEGCEDGYKTILEFYSRPRMKCVIDVPTKLDARQSRLIAGFISGQIQTRLTELLNKKLDLLSWSAR